MGEAKKYDLVYNHAFYQRETEGAMMGYIFNICGIFVWFCDRKYKRAILDHLSSVPYVTGKPKIYQ